VGGEAVESSRSGEDGGGREEEEPYGERAGRAFSLCRQVFAIKSLAIYNIFREL
jgi:hypothetical protein